MQIYVLSVPAFSENILSYLNLPTEDKICKQLHYMFALNKNANTINSQVTSFKFILVQLTIPQKPTNIQNDPLQINRRILHHNVLFVQLTTLI